MNYFKGRMRVSGCKTFINKFGFTLAETLITLAIIGIVAAIVIPVVYNNFQNESYVNALKKFYATANQALKQMSYAKGCVDNLQCTGLFSASSDTLSLGTEFVKYFKVAKDCQMTANSNCWAAKTNEYFDGSGSDDTWDSSTTSYKFLTIDGMSVLLANSSNDCNTPTYTNNVSGDLSQKCGYLIVDVNGLKGPNRLGRDTFWFWITNGKGASLYPNGGPDDKVGGSTQYWKSIGTCANPKSGWQCAGRVIDENWNMNY